MVRNHSKIYITISLLSSSCIIVIADARPHRKRIPAKETSGRRLLSGYVNTRCANDHDYWANFTCTNVSFTLKLGDIYYMMITSVIMDINLQMEAQTLWIGYVKYE